MKLGESIMRFCFPCLLLVCISVAQAQTYKSGDKVMINNRDAKMAESGKDANTGVELGDVFTVTKTNGDWLWIGRGWIAKSNVVPYDQAIAYFTDQIRRDKSQGTYYNDRATAFAKMGELDKAIADETDAIQLDAGHPENLAVEYNTRGLMWYDKGVYDLAIADYNEVIRNEPNDPEAYFNRGLSWKKIKQYDKAIADYDEAIRLNPEHVGAFDNRGDAWKAKGNYDKALSDYNQAIKIDPKNSSGYSSLAWLCATCPDEKIRNGAMAVESATKACDLDNWQDADDADTLAAAYAERGDFESAVKWQTKALELKLDVLSDKKPEELRARLELYKSGKPYREELKK
jgi:tetratricopeptide (TPR) repeat protein